MEHAGITTGPAGPWNRRPAQIFAAAVAAAMLCLFSSACTEDASTGRAAPGPEFVDEVMARLLCSDSPVAPRRAARWAHWTDSSVLVTVQTRLTRAHIPDATWAEAPPRFCDYGACLVPLAESEGHGVPLTVSLRNVATEDRAVFVAPGFAINLLLSRARMEYLSPTAARAGPSWPSAPGDAVVVGAGKEVLLDYAVTVPPDAVPGWWLVGVYIDLSGRPWRDGCSRSGLGGCPPPERWNGAIVWAWCGMSEDALASPYCARASTVVSNLVPICVLP